MLETNAFPSWVWIKHLFPTTSEKRVFHRTFVNEKVENYSYTFTYFIALILTSSYIINNFLQDTTKRTYQRRKTQTKKLYINYRRIIYYHVWNGKIKDTFRRPNFNFNSTINTPKSLWRKKIKYCQANKWAFGSLK